MKRTSHLTNVKDCSSRRISSNIFLVSLVPVDHHGTQKGLRYDSRTSPSRSTWSLNAFGMERLLDSPSPRWMPTCISRHLAWLITSNLAAQSWQRRNISLNILSGTMWDATGWTISKRSSRVYGLCPSVAGHYKFSRPAHRLCST